MHHFFAYMSRMRFIRRWSLMRNTQAENIQEHSLQVAMIAHNLAILGNQRFGRHYDAEHIAVLAMYHEAAEVITGDLPTPVKYFSHQLRSSYGEVERLANEKLLSTIPSDLRSAYEPLLNQENDDSHALVKAADRISAYLKCLEEEQSGNSEFRKAGESILEDINSLNLTEVKAFMQDFVPSFRLSLDEMQ